MKNVRRLTEGAVLLAIYAILLLISIYVPLLGAVSFIFLPLPFIYAAWKNDWKGIIVFLIASLIISLIVGTVFALPMSFMLGTTGITLGYLAQKNKSRVTILITASLVMLINMIIIYGAAATFFHYNFIDEATKLLNKSYNLSFEMLKGIGRGDEIDKLKEQLNTMLTVLNTLLPSILVVGSFGFVFIIQLINFPVLKRLGMKVTHWKPFRDLALPRSILWYFLISFILTFILKPEQGSYLYLALWNLVSILQILLVIQGLSLVYFFSYIKKWPKAIPIVATVFMFLLPVMLEIYRILGIIDLGFEIRKRIKNNQS